MGGNAVTATVSWHLVEPVEGSYDFSGVDRVISAKSATLAPRRPGVVGLYLRIPMGFDPQSFRQP